MKKEAGVQIKFVLNLAIVSFLAGAVAGSSTDSSRAWAQAESFEVPLMRHADPGPVPASKAPRPINLAAARWQIREMTAVLQRDPDNSDCRLKLATCMEMLALYFEQKGDYLNGDKYYDGAARYLDYPKGKGWKKRIAEDEKKAAKNRQMRVDYLKGLKIKGWVFTSFNWKVFKNLDAKAASDYISKVGLPIKTNWSVAERSQIIHFPEELEKPPLVVSFSVHRDGTITDVKVTKSCGIPSYDAAAVEAVKTAGKVPPLLPGMGEVVSFTAQYIK